MKNYERINEMLETKSKLNKQPMCFVLKKVHESLRRKIKSTRENGIRKYLLNHLYEVMPKRKE